MAEGVTANIRVGIDATGAKEGAAVAVRSLNDIKKAANDAAKAVAAIPGAAPSTRPSSRPSSPGGSTGTDPAMRAQIAATKALEAAETRRYTVALRIQRQMGEDAALMARNSAATQELTAAIKANGASSEATAKAWGNFRREQAAISSDIAKNSGLFVKMNTQTQAITGSVNSLGEKFKAARPQIQNTSFQVADFAVQIASGQSAVVALAQQLPQLLGGLGVFGALAGAAVAILGGLATALFSSGDAAKKSNEDLDRFNSAMEDSKKSASIAEEGYDSLIKKLNTLTETSRRALVATLQQSIEANESALRSGAQDLSGSLLSEDTWRNVIRAAGAFGDAAGNARKEIYLLAQGLQESPSDPGNYGRLAEILRTLALNAEGDAGPAFARLADRLDVAGGNAEALALKNQKLETAQRLANGEVVAGAAAILNVGDAASGTATMLSGLIAATDGVGQSFSRLRREQALTNAGGFIRYDPHMGESPTIPDRPNALGETFAGVDPSSLETDSRSQQILDALAGQLKGTASASKSAATAAENLGQKYQDQAADIRATLDEQNKLNAALAANDNGSGALSDSVELLSQKLKISSKYTGDQRAELENLTEELFRAKKAGDAWSNVVNLRDANSLLEKQIELAGDSSTSAKKSLDLFKAEQSLRRDGVDLQSEVGKATLDEVSRQSDLNDELQRQQSIYSEIENIGSQAFDRIGSAITEAFTTGKGSAVDFASVAMGAISELGQSVLKLGAINPIKNWISGSQLPTLDNLFSTASGGGIGGLGSWLFGTAGSAPAPGAEGPIKPPTSGLLGSGGQLWGMKGSDLMGGGMAVLGSALPGLMSGNYAQAALGGGGALAGTLIAGPVGGAIGGCLGSVLGGLFEFDDEGISK
ncbi:MAG: hypothetical protein ACRC67_03880 [Inquilinus sp.]|uniref:hypothetical protein n=1 Tax=Inquilinus sp. TaxID=1932117 RepID=UPI003F3ACF8F